jgi:hypothetical protein
MNPSTSRARYPLARRWPLVTFAAFAICTSVAHAQVPGRAFEGTFTAAVPNGQTTLTFAVAERVSGVLAGPGLAIDLIGDLDPSDGAVRGLATAGDESVGFEATLRGDGLTFVLFEFGTDGRPDLRTAVSLELQRVPAPAPAPGGRSAGLPSKGQATRAPSAATLTSDLVQAVHDGVEEALSLPESLLELAIDAALEAGRLDGTGIALAGTLGQRNDGTLRFARDATDALRVDLIDGRTFAIAFLAAPRGNLESGDAFVEDPHIVDIRVTGGGADGLIDLRLTSTPLAQDGGQDVRMTGRFSRGNVNWDVQARLERFERYVVDGIVDGEIRIQGQVTLFSEDLGAAVTSARTYRYRIVNVVENVDHTIDTDIAVGDDRVRLSGRVFVAFREGRPVDRDQWVVQGGLARGATALGAFGINEGPTGLRVVLELGGSSLPLYTFPY